ncbi:MAG TPA: potassium channel protein [bacterium]|nr:potassium channel protein [bacterium]
MNVSKKKSFIKKILRTTFILIFLIATGITGYMQIENASFTDAFYLTVIAISTTGLYSGPALSVHGKIFTIFLIIVGIIMFVQCINILATAVINDYFNSVFRKRRIFNMIKDLKNHIIICGCGELGIEIIKEMTDKKQECVVIDRNPEIKNILDSVNFSGIFLEGDAARDDILESAGITRARCLISCMGDDAQNVFAVLTARELNKSLHILSRCVSSSTKSKLLRAGANKIILPNYLGAKRMAAFALRPEIANFLDTLMFDENNSDIRIENITIPPNSILSGKSLSELKLPARTGIIIVAIKNTDGAVFFNPAHNTIINNLDMLIALGPEKNIQKVYELIEMESLEYFDKKNSIKKSN